MLKNLSYLATKLVSNLQMRSWEMFVTETTGLPHMKSSSGILHNVSHTHTHTHARTQYHHVRTTKTTIFSRTEPFSSRTS